MPLSPMMQQYRDLKDQYKDYILFYRLGDFYEMFFEDALLASKELEITLTGRDCGLEEKAPMCGVPYHSVDAYIARLVQRGYKVSICEQVKDPETNLITGREVVRIITPGTITEPQMLDETKNSYIVGIFADKNINGEVAFCFADVSTGDILISESYKKTDFNIINELSKFTPREAYLNSFAAEIPLLKSFLSEPENNCILSNGDEQSFEYESSVEIIEKHMHKNLEELNLKHNKLPVQAFGGLLDYLYKTQFCDLSHVKNLFFLNSVDFVDIDFFTWRNLEITETMRSKSKKGSLLGVLDKTKTPMGARLLRKFLEKPLASISEIIKRQTAVLNLYEKDIIRTEVRALLSSIGDVERLVSKLVYGTINPRDMRMLAASFEVIPKIKDQIKTLNSTLLIELNKNINPLDDLFELIDNSIIEEPPISIRDGNIIKKTYDETLCELKSFVTDNKQIIADIEAREKEKTGIKNLKINYNKIFGYYIEISKSFLPQVPENYIRKQTLVNGERFITAELKDIETKLLSANDDIVKLEYELFIKIKDTVLESLVRIKKTAESLAFLDTLASMAEVSQRNQYCCPQIVQGGTIDIKEGRHPVVEKMLKDELFVPNDTFLDNAKSRIALITGPNMAGKSTYMRQVAIIMLMAQIGCFVPAAYAKIGIVDKIFTRVGASDDLSSGQSTFMVEMNEVAYILKNATPKSLLIFDEIGRGTSTFDGMSIAQAVIEYVANKTKAKTLFATHYHELIQLENSFPCLQNYNIAAKKKNNDIIFLRKIIKGGTDDSYGIEVAKLAGVPQEVISRAEAILKTLEINKEKIPQKEIIAKEDNSMQTTLVSSINDEIIEFLKNVDVTVLTPIEAMNELFAISKKAKNNN